MMNFFVFLLYVNTFPYFDNFHVVFCREEMNEVFYASVGREDSEPDIYPVIYTGDDLNILRSITTSTTTTTTPIGNATLYQDFFNEITIAKFQHLDQSSVVIYGGPKNLTDRGELYHFVLNFIRTKLRVPSMAASDIINVRYIGVMETTKGKPIQVMLRTPEIKEHIMRNRRYIREPTFKVEEFFSKAQTDRLARLLKLMKKLRHFGHFAIVKDKALYVDHVPVKDTKKDLMNQFPYIPAVYFEGL